MTLLANVISVVCYPLFIPTYGVALFCYSYSVQVNPLHWIWILIAVVGTFVLTCALPLSAIGILMLRGKVKDIQIEDSKERTVPFIYSLCGFGFWSYLMNSVLHAPAYIGLTCIGATVAIGLIALINRWWKISAHMTGIGGLFGGLLSYCLGIGAIPTWSTWCTWLIGALVVMYARLRLNAHTGAQVSAGYLLGILCTFLPYYIVSYVV